MPHLTKQSTASASVWNPLDEAEVYLEEATWAGQWGQYERMQEAIEAAWSLGLQREECALLRVRAYLDLFSLPKNVYTERGAGCERVSLPRPTIESFKGAVATVDVFEDYLRLFPSEGRPCQNTWMELGCKVLDEASVVLMANFVDPARSNQGEEWKRETQMLRTRCRDLLELMRHAAVRAACSDTPLSTKEFNHDYHVDITLSEWLDSLSLRYGGLWHEDPRQAATFLETTYKRYASQQTDEALHRLDEAIFNRPFYLPWLANWDNTPEKQFQPLVVESCKRLVNPSRPTSLLHSRFLELKSVRDPADVKVAASHLADAFIANKGWGARRHI